MEEGALELAKAAQAKGAQDVKTAAAKVNAACNNCHAVYRQ
jgi:cytochrome c556